MPKSHQHKARLMSERLIERFAAGNMAAPMAQLFLLQDADLPQNKWSYLNRLFCLLSGCTDARGFRQWQAVGRSVSKGERAAAYIRIPVTRKTKTKSDEDDGDDMAKQAAAAPETWFKWLPVFDVSQTDGDDLPYQEAARDHIDTLPLIDVARNWNITVSGYSGASAPYLGFFSRQQQQIGLGVSNLSPWLHELMHAADQKLGTLTEKRQHWRPETVAEFGGCVLAHLIGEPDQADEGGCFDYITHYADEADLAPITACTQVIERVVACIDLILTASSTNASPHHASSL